MYCDYRKVRVCGIAAAVPEHILDNVEYASNLQDKRLKRQVLYTGIKQRRCVSGKQRTSDLATIAAESIMDKLGWKREDVSALIFITQNADMYAPSTAMLIQTHLGLSQDCIAMDINWGCAGFTSGLQVLASILRSTKGKGLVLMGDCQHYTPGTEFESGDTVLFGDGAAAAALEFTADPQDHILCDQKTDGSRFKALYAPLNGPRKMDGNAILLFSLNEVVNMISEFPKHFGLKDDDIDFVALHQAQKIIIDGIANNCGIAAEKLVNSYEYYGNTSSASVPISICVNTNRYTKEKTRFFTCGYGIGLIWSSAYFEVETENILPIITSDYTYTALF